MLDPFFWLMYILIAVFLYLVLNGTIEFRRNGEILNPPEASAYYSE